MILIVTNTQDPHADQAIKILKKRGNEIFRLNTEHFLDAYRTVIAINPQGSWTGFCQDELGRNIDLARCRVGWIRRPDFSFSYGESLDGDVTRYIMSEYKAFISNLYALPNIQFVNDHFRGERAKNKIQQLIHAAELGIRVPRTLVTNDPNEASLFVESCSGSVLAKPIYTANFTENGIPQGISSVKISREEFAERRHLISAVPTKLQEYVEKQFEVRAVVVMDHLFAVRIDSQLHDETKVDWRARTLMCPHSVIKIPVEVERFCREFIARQGLVYGAIDFIVSPEGEYVFLENNPAGQYLWLEEATGVPITDALCDLFEAVDAGKVHLH